MAKKRKTFVDGYVSTSAAIDKITRQFCLAKVKPPFKVEKIVLDNIHFQNNPLSNRQRLFPVLRFTIINNRVRFLKSEINEYAQLLITLTKAQNATLESEAA